MNDEKITIPVVFSIDDNYIRPLLTTVLSLYEHADPTKTFYHLYILHYQLKEENKQQLIELQKSHHPQGAVTWLQLSDEQYERIPACYGWNKEINFRLLLAEILDLDRVIYLDADLLVLGDLSSLFALKLGDNAFAAVAEERSNYRSYIIMKYFLDCEKREEMLSLANMALYPNSGVLLMNLKIFREMELTDKALFLLRHLPKEGYWQEYAVPKNHHMEVLPDQDVLFYLAYHYSKGILWLPESYNHIVGYYTHHNDKAVDNEVSYTSFVSYINHYSDLDHKMQSWVEYKPIIIHYAAFAPWKKKYGDVPYEALYRSYAEKIGWKLPNKAMVNLITHFKRRILRTERDRTIWALLGITSLMLGGLFFAALLISLLLWIN